MFLPSYLTPQISIHSISKDVMLVPVLVLPQNWPDQVALLHQKSAVLVPDQAAQDPMVLATLVQEYVLRQAFRSES